MSMELEYFDIVVTQAMLFTEDVLVPLAAEGGGFVSQVREKESRWPQWQVIRPETIGQVGGFEHGGVLRALAYAFKFECALCQRVHNHQKSTDLGLDFFWRDPCDTPIRLIERSYSLIATDFGQFILVFCFRFHGGTPEERSDMLVRITSRRAVRANIGQQKYSLSAIHMAGAEIERLTSAFRTTKKGSTGHSIASPTVHDTIGWIKYAEDLTAYPWIFTGELSDNVCKIFSAEDVIRDLAYKAPIAGDPCCIIGNNYGLLCDLEGVRPIRLEILPLLIYAQASYYTISQVRKVILNELRLACADEKPEYNAKILEDFERFSLYFNRYIIGYEQFFSSQIPKLKFFSGKIPWMSDVSNAHDYLMDALNRHRAYLRSKSDERAHKDAKRQEIILFGLAMLQVFSLISVLVDYHQLNPNIGDKPWILQGQAWPAEMWVYDWSPFLPRWLSITVLLFWTWYLFPTIFRAVRNLNLKFMTRLRNLYFPNIKNQRKSTIVFNKIRIGSSAIHGIGLFSLKKYSAGDIILDLNVKDFVLNFEFLAGNDVFKSRKLSFNRNRVDDYITTNVLNYINPSRLPNSIIEPIEGGNKTHLIADKKIDIGDEILINYLDHGLTASYINECGGYL